MQAGFSDPDVIDYIKRLYVAVQIADRWTLIQQTCPSWQQQSGLGKTCASAQERDPYVLCDFVHFVP